MGVVFPQTEIGNDPAAIRDFAQCAEDLGYAHLAAFDHVLGANPASRPGWSGLYTHQSAFHEVFVLFGYLAGVTTSIGFATCVLVLPQRQTALVAKQAAALDVLSGGRLRLGVAVGWNSVEYEALGENFTTRGARIEEQIAVLRALWTGNPIDFKGARHLIDDAGLCPLPVQRPIPVWLGGMADVVIERVGRLADGWFPRFPGLGKRGPDTVMPIRGEAPEAVMETMRAHARAAGRDPATIGVEGRVRLSGRTPDQWAEELAAWHALGATHMQLYTMGGGLASPDDHMALLRQYHDALMAG
jgi:probable F420-dependent oxidoreductase